MNARHAKPELAPPGALDGVLVVDMTPVWIELWAVHP